MLELFAKRLAPYYIYAPDYRRSSSGIRVMHMLCDLLQRSGQEAYVSSRVVCPDLVTPRLTQDVVEQHRSQGIEPIVVYPEITDGNPLNGNIVVRYILNQPGFVEGRGLFGSDDLLFSYTKGLLQPGMDESHVLFFPVPDLRIFCPPSDPAKRIPGKVCYYQGRRGQAAIDPSLLPADAVEITARWPESWEALADLFQQCEVFYCSEASSLAGEAALCGCLGVVIPNEWAPRRIASHEFKGYGVAWGTDPAEVERARKTIPLLRKLTLEYQASFWPALDHFIEVTQAAATERAAKNKGGQLQSWLASRVPSKVQNELIQARFRDQPRPKIGLFVLDQDGDSKRVERTLQSLDSSDAWHVHVLSASAISLPVDGSIGLSRLGEESCADALNRVIANSNVDWIMLVQAGDEFTPSGLMIAGLELAANPECRAVYGDHLQKLSDGNLGGVLLPSVNLDLLLSFPLVMARHWLYRRDVFLAAGGFDGDFAQAMEFELLTRLIEQEGLVGLGHIDELLLITEAPTLRDNSDECRVIKRHLSHRGYQAQIQPGLPARYRIHYGHMAKPLVSILVATNVSLILLQRCIDTLLEKTQYAHYELLLVDGDASPEVSAWLKQVASLEDNKLRVILADTARSAQSVAAERAKGEYLLMLSGETAIVEANWLDELLNHAQRPEVGIVGGKLLAPDGCIQQASLILGLNGPVGYPFVGEPINAAGYMNRLQVDQNCSAVAGACLMVRKALYEQVGGVDEKLFGATYSHVDLCLKVGALGYLSVWTPRAVLLHEGQVNQAKLNAVDPAAQEAMYSKWLPRLARDPAYNLNLSLTEPGGFRLADTSLSWRPLDSWRPLPVVLAHPADNTGCGHYRVIQPLNALKNAGLVDGSLQRNLLSVTELERYNPDTIILQRQIYPEQLETMRRMKAFSKAFRVYELDDYLPNIPLKSVHRQHMPKDVLKSLKRGISYSDRFVVSTERLAEVFSSVHSDIRVVHNRLDPLVWENLVSLKRQSHKPRVGWAGGVGHTGDLEMIADVVKALSDEVDWVFFGMCPDKLRPYIKEFHLGVPIEDYPQKLASLNLDLALAPLEQNLFNECKSNLRLLEYGACAVPVICSDVRCYAGDLPVTRVKNRFRDWIEAVRTHLADLDEAARQGSALQAMVQRDWMLKGERLASWQKAWLA